MGDKRLRPWDYSFLASNECIKRHMHNVMALSPELGGQLLVIAKRAPGRIQFGVMKEKKIQAIGSLMDSDQALQAALAIIKLLLASTAPEEHGQIMKRIRDQLPELFNS